MNKITSLAAIAMVAVVMGMSAFVPAIMAAPNTVDICHNDKGEDGDRNASEDNFWEIISVNSHAVDKHIAKHFDGSAVFDFQIVGSGTLAACNTLIAGNP